MEAKVILSSDSMWSHPEIPHTPHVLNIRPCSHAIQRCGSQRQPASESGWVWSCGIWRRSGDMTAARGLSVIDLRWICPASALFKHEHVLRWFLPDDDLRGDISLPGDHVTYKMLCDDLSSTHIPILHPLCHHSYVLAASPNFIYPLTSNLYLPHNLQELIILTVDSNIKIGTPTEVCHCHWANITKNVT